MIASFLRIAVAAAALAASSAMAQAPMVSGEPALATKALAPAPRLRIQETATINARALRTQAQLSPVADSEIEAVRNANRASTQAKRLVIGVVRAGDGTPLPSAADLAWVNVDGGHAAQAAVTSPDAAALRLAIDLAGVPANVEMVFFGSAASDRLIGPFRVGDIADRTAPWWSPITEGDTQTVEFFVPGEADVRSLPLRVAQVSHLFASPSSRFSKRLQDIGDSGACEVDILCSSLSSSTAFQNATNAVAQMVFNDGVFTGLCTGTLLNDSDPSTQVPWFYSANHCFENETAPYKTPTEMQTMANTLATIWFFEANACNSGVPLANYQQVNGGATYIYNNTQYDVLFLRLNSAPPSGAFFAGWDASSLSAGAAVLTIHHPEGDLKKVSPGNVLDFSSPGSVGGGTVAFIRVGWGSAVTEPGSSGAGLFTNSGSQYLLRGGLYGGPSSCAAPASTRYDYFSRFDLVYGSLAAYLGTSSAPNTDYTDLWWGGAGESGWGLNLVQHPSKKIFAVWYTYDLDGTRIWYVMSDGTWTSSTTYTGALYVTSGSAANAVPYIAAQVRVTAVGTGTLNFTDANNGTWTYSVNGVSGTKVITRQPF